MERVDVTREEYLAAKEHVMDMRNGVKPVGPAFLKLHHDASLLSSALEAEAYMLIIVDDHDKPISGVYLNDREYDELRLRLIEVRTKRAALRDQDCGTPPERGEVSTTKASIWESESPLVNTVSAYVLFEEQAEQINSRLAAMVRSRAVENLQTSVADYCKHASGEELALLNEVFQIAVTGYGDGMRFLLAFHELFPEAMRDLEKQNAA